MSNKEDIKCDNNMTDLLRYKKEEDIAFKYLN